MKNTKPCPYCGVPNGHGMCTIHKEGCTWLMTIPFRSICDLPIHSYDKAVIQALDMIQHQMDLDYADKHWNDSL